MRNKRINFGTKEELNSLRQKSFLALSGSERVDHFLRMMQWSNEFYGRKAYINPSNFLIDLTTVKK